MAAHLPSAEHTHIFLHNKMASLAFFPLCTSFFFVFTAQEANGTTFHTAFTFCSFSRRGSVHPSELPYLSVEAFLASLHRDRVRFICASGGQRDLFRSTPRRWTHHTRDTFTLFLGHVKRPPGIDFNRILLAAIFLLASTYSTRHSRFRSTFGGLSGLVELNSPLLPKRLFSPAVFTRWRRQTFHTFAPATFRALFVAQIATLSSTQIPARCGQRDHAPRLHFRHFPARC